MVSFIISSFLLFVIIFVTLIYTKQSNENPRQGLQFKNRLFVIQLAYGCFLLLVLSGCQSTSQPTVPVESAPTLTAEILEADTKASAVPTEEPLTFDLDVAYAERVDVLLQKWQEYTYSTIAPKEKDAEYYEYSTNRLELLPETTSFIYQNDFGLIFTGGNSILGVTTYATLYSFPDNRLIAKQSSDQGDIVIEWIKEGDYYYSVSCEGYHTYYSPVYHFTGNGEDELVWSAPLTAVEAKPFTEPFSVQMIDQQQTPYANQKLFLAITERTEDGGMKKHIDPFITDDNGFVCQRIWRNGSDNDPELLFCLFSASENLTIEVCNESYEQIGEFVPAGNRNNIVTIG